MQIKAKKNLYPIIILQFCDSGFFKGVIDVILTKNKKIDFGIII